MHSELWRFLYIRQDIQLPRVSWVAGTIQATKSRMRFWQAERRPRKSKHAVQPYGRVNWAMKNVKMKEEQIGVRTAFVVKPFPNSNCSKNLETKNKKTAFKRRFICWHLPIFPGRHQPSIFGTNELNFRVRDGNGWTLIVINTNSCRAPARLQYNIILFRKTQVFFSFFKKFLSPIQPAWLTIPTIIIHIATNMTITVTARRIIAIIKNVLAFLAYIGISGLQNG